MSRTAATQHPTTAQYAYLTALAAGEPTRFSHPIATQLACNMRGWVRARRHDEDYALTDAGRAAIERGVRPETPVQRRRRAARKIITAIAKITAETDLTIDDIADALGADPAGITASAATFRDHVIGYGVSGRPVAAATRRLARDIELMVMCPVSEKVIGLCATDCPSGHRDRSLFMNTRERQMRQLKGD